MSITTGFLLFLALGLLAWGALGIAHWVVNWYDARRDAAFRAEQLVARARAEVRR